MCDFKSDMKKSGWSDSSIKEFLSIKNDYNKIIVLLNKENLLELENHLHDIQMKYLKETIVYNSINTIKPVSIQERSKNCLHFLEQLAKSKGFEFIIKNHAMLFWK